MNSNQMGKFMAFVNYISNLDLCTSLQMLDRHLIVGAIFLGPPHLHFLFRYSDLDFLVW